MEKTKFCNKCGVVKIISLFSKNKTRKGGVNGFCKDCSKSYRIKNIDKYKKYSAEYKEVNKDSIKEKRKPYREKNAFKISQQVRSRKFKSRYGITKEQYDLMCGLQEFECLICNRQVLFPERLNVDHDHKTGKIRGLLCGDCNRGLGCFKDNPEALKNAIKYLKN